MKIRSVKSNNIKQEFSVVTYSGVEYSFPYSKADPRPAADNRIEEISVDKELGKEAFTYALESGEEGTVHLEQVLEYNEDPKYLADLLTYKLSLEAQKCIEDSELSRLLSSRSDRQPNQCKQRNIAPLGRCCRVVMCQSTFW